jgi:murein DD-endopeptidase MepM/ murein hydrolase activator NlpD
MRVPINANPGYAYGATPYPLRILNPDGTVFGWKHHGQDFPSPQGREVIAPHGGRVVMADWNGSAGKEVRIVNGGFVSRLLHLQHTAVSVGQTVKEGQRVGLSGNTGFTTGPHLHWSLSLNGKYVNPNLYTLPPKPPAAVKVYHKVNKGENLTVIAKQYGTTVANIVKLNNIKNPNVISIGQLLRIK